MGIPFDLPELDRRSVGEQEQRERDLGDRERQLISDPELQDVERARTEQEAGCREEHRRADAPSFELQRHQGVTGEDRGHDRQSGHGVRSPRVRLVRTDAARGAMVDLVGGLAGTWSAGIRCGHVGDVQRLDGAPVDPSSVGRVRRPDGDRDGSLSCCGWGMRWPRRAMRCRRRG